MDTNDCSISRETSLAGRTIRRRSDGVIGAIISKKNASPVYEVMWWLDSGGVDFSDIHRRDFDIEPQKGLDDLVAELREYVNDTGGDFKALEADAANRCFGDNQLPMELSTLDVQQIVDDIIENCGDEMQ